MALQTRHIQVGKTDAAPGIAQRAAASVFRNRRPLGLIATGAITAAGYLATGAARPDLALLFNTYWSMSSARVSLDAHLELERLGHKRSSLTMLSAGIMDMVNMALSFLPFLSWVHKSNEYVKTGFAYMCVLGVTALAAQAMEKRARFDLLKDKFDSVFNHMEIGECAEYLRGLEKRERSWWRKPYWMLHPMGLEELRDEKAKVGAYMGNRVQSKSL